MSTLQSLRTWVTFNKFVAHRVASIGFLKYISTSFTLHSTAKQRVINALMKVKLNDEDISALQECNSIISDNASNNKRLPDGNRKEPTTPDKPSYSLLLIFPPNVWDLVMEIQELLQLPIKLDVTPLMLHY